MLEALGGAHPGVPLIVVLTDLAPQDAALLPDAAATQEADAAKAQEKATGKARTTAQKKAEKKAERKAARKAKKAEQHDTDTHDTDSHDTDGAQAAAGRTGPDPKEQP